MHKVKSVFIGMLFFAASSSNLYAQPFFWNREVDPSDYNAEQPELPRLSTAGMFVKACLSDTSPYYSGNDFTYFYRVTIPPLIEEVNPLSTPFVSIFEEESWGINGEHVAAAVLRPEFGEYLIYVRAYEGGRHTESCSIATNTKSQIELLLDIQKTFPEMNYDLGEMQVRGGNVQFTATLQDQLKFVIREGETDGFAWIATRISHP